MCTYIYNYIYMYIYIHNHVHVVELCCFTMVSSRIVSTKKLERQSTTILVGFYFSAILFLYLYTLYLYPSPQSHQIKSLRQCDPSSAFFGLLSCPFCEGKQILYRTYGEGPHILCTVKLCRAVRTAEETCLQTLEKKLGYVYIYI